MATIGLQGKTAAFSLAVLLLGFGFYSAWETQTFLQKAVPLEGTISYSTKHGLMVECKEEGAEGSRIIEVRKPFLSLPWDYRLRRQVSIVADLSGPNFSSDFNPLVRARARVNGFVPLWGAGLLSLTGGVLMLLLGCCMILLPRRGNRILFQLACQTEDRPSERRI